MKIKSLIFALTLFFTTLDIASTLFPLSLGFGIVDLNPLFSLLGAVSFTILYFLVNTMILGLITYVNFKYGSIVFLAYLPLLFVHAVASLNNITLTLNMIG